MEIEFITANQLPHNKIHALLDHLNDMEEFKYKKIIFERTVGSDIFLTTLNKSFYYKIDRNKSIKELIRDFDLFVIENID